ncbi:hypothetical protein [Candidatus Finniella inopinata]|uniref:Uncharacterized protein n=1 Tax=Candidatus Finniella inopinata TaxID=1696036 RepID=A0A4Q7DK32_9PROT|nr:hypothetical protein [Candidatus Finniella inopinata]RZI46649.1 hypothetical protein EQU50_03425 [Candidatus Finniella inopinata]
MFPFLLTRWRLFIYLSYPILVGMSTRKTADLKVHRRYARLIARTAVLGVEDHSPMEFPIKAITASNLGH